MSSFLRSAECNKYHFPHKQTPEHGHACTHTNWLRQIQLTPNVWASPTASSCLCGDSWERAGQWATLTNVQPQLHRVRKREKWQFLLWQGHLHCSNPRGLGSDDFLFFPLILSSSLLLILKQAKYKLSPHAQSPVMTAAVKAIWIHPGDAVSVQVSRPAVRQAIAIMMGYR